MRGELVTVRIAAAGSGMKKENFVDVTLEYCAL
jgi:hypothetical protein